MASYKSMTNHLATVESRLVATGMNGNGIE